MTTRFVGPAVAETTLAYGGGKRSAQIERRAWRSATRLMASPASTGSSRPQRRPTVADLIERATKEMCLAGGCPDLNGPCPERGLHCWACVGREDEAVAAISVGLSALCQAFPDIRPLVHAFAREHGLEPPEKETDGG